MAAKLVICFLVAVIAATVSADYYKCSYAGQTKHCQTLIGSSYLCCYKYGSLTCTTNCYGSGITVYGSWESSDSYYFDDDYSYSYYSISSIIGGVIGTIVFIVTIIVIAVCIRQRRFRHMAAMRANQTPMVISSVSATSNQQQAYSYPQQYSAGGHNNQGYYPPPPATSPGYSYPPAGSYPQQPSQPAAQDMAPPSYNMATGKVA